MPKNWDKRPKGFGNNPGEPRKRGGRTPGSVNKIPRLIKEAIVLAAEEVGEVVVTIDPKDGRPLFANGPDGLTGYLRHLAKNEPKAFATLLGRVLPLQITGLPNPHDPKKLLSREELASELRQRGLPDRFFVDVTPKKNVTMISVKKNGKD